MREKISYDAACYELAEDIIDLKISTRTAIRVISKLFVVGTGKAKDDLEERQNHIRWGKD